MDGLIDRLELTHVKVKRDRSGDRFLYEVRGAQSPGVFARHFPPATGHELESRSGAPPAIYSPELQLLFRIFPADRKLESLTTLADGMPWRPSSRPP